MLQNNNDNNNNNNNKCITINDNIQLNKSITKLNLKTPIY